MGPGWPRHSPPRHSPRAMRHSTLAACLGVSPHSDHRLHRALLHLYSLLYYVALSSCILLTLFVLQKKDPAWYGSLIYLLIEKLELGVVLVSYSAAVVTGLSQQSALREVQAQLEQTDRQLACPCAGRGRVPAVAALRYLALAAVAGLDLLARPAAVLPYQLLHLVSYYGPLLSITALQVEHFAVLEALGQRLAALSELLRGAREVERLHALLRAEDRLRAACHSAAGAFAGAALSGLGAVFFAAVVCGHRLASGRSYRLAASPSLLALSAAAALLARGLELWSIVQPYVSLTNKVRDFHAVLYNSVVLDRSGKLTQSEKIQCHIALNRDITFTAAGFFTIDFSLAHSMVGAVTTFVVILLQYDAGS